MDWHWTKTTGHEKTPLSNGSIPHHARNKFCLDTCSSMRASSRVPAHPCGCLSFLSVFCSIIPSYLTKGHAYVEPVVLVTLGIHISTPTAIELSQPASWEYIKGGILVPVSPLRLDGSLKKPSPIMPSSLFVLLALAPLVSSRALLSRTTPDYDALNSSVSGRLFASTPLSLPCWSEYEGAAREVDEAACSVIQQNYTNPLYRAGFYSGVMNGQDDACLSNVTDQCLLDGNNPTLIPGKSCNQGALSRHYIDVQGPKDVQAAFAFARKTGVTLSIKNSGHDYNGRNTNKGSLALWVRNLKNKTFHESFVPEGCSKDKSYRAISLGPGVTTGEAYLYADTVNSTVLGAYANTVGSGAGWIMGGGQNILAPNYGIGADRPRQFKVVTPDGKYRTANECQNTDLFWALRGGGPGTFGVVLETTVQAEKTLPLAVSSMTFNVTDGNVRPWIQLLVNESLGWAQDGWGGHIVGWNNFLHVNPKLSLDDAKESMTNATTFVQGQNGTAVIEHLPSFYAFYSKYVLQVMGKVGQFSLSNSRLIPTEIFNSTKGRENLTGFLENLYDSGESIYVPVACPYPYQATKRSDTSANPIWSDCVWHLEVSSTLNVTSSLQDRQKIAQSQADIYKQMESFTPGSGVYMNEGFPLLDSWKEAYWGKANYAKLLEIKKKIDPEFLLNCNRCVGSDEAPERWDEAKSCWEGLLPSQNQTRRSH